MAQSIRTPVRSLVAVQHHSIHALGLVVNQEAGQRWAEQDSMMQYRHLRGEPGALLVRLMGHYTTHVTDPANDKLWGECREPREVVTMRWMYISTIPNLPWVVAGPDTGSIEKFFGACRTCEALGMTGATFVSELQILIQHLKGIVKEPDDMSIFERRYRAMLAEVLPLRTEVAPRHDASPHN